MRGLADFIGNLVILYVLVVCTALGAIKWNLIASVILGIGTGAHENVTSMRDSLSQSERSGTYPW